MGNIMVSPQTRELREELDSRGIEYETDDVETEDDYGTFRHAERTIVGDRVALYAWSRDADERKRWDSAGGRFGYIEVVGGSPSMCDVSEALAAMIE